MRRRSSVTMMGTWILAGTATFAAAVWEKPFATWTPSEIKALRAESPWAGKMTLTHVVPGGGARPIDDTVVARWASALPLRRADVRESMGTDGTATPEMERALAIPYDFYEVALKVEGISAGIAAMSPIPIGRETFLRRDGKAPIAAVKVESRRLDKNGKVIDAPAPTPPGQAPAAGRGGGRGGGFGGGGGATLIIFAFPKTDPIAVGDKDVEIVTKIGQYNAKKKFKLKDMVINGELAL